MIVVYDVDGTSRDHSDATRFATDEHNNLAVYVGSAGDKLRYLYHPDLWRYVEVDEDG